MRLFRETVSRVNAKDYTVRQIEAWLGSDTADVRAKWQTSLLAHRTYLAWLDGEVVGFADMTTTGYLDRLFVSADHQGEGIATRLLVALEQAIPADLYTTEASITARPFFESQGFRVMKRNVVVRDGIELINFTMRKTK